MAKTVGGLDEAGRIRTGEVRRVRQVSLPVTIINTRWKRIARNLWG